MRIDRTFERLRAQNRCALVAYLVAGQPSPSGTVEAMHALVASGTDVIELGIPFSDPIADGPVIARAHSRALAAGTDMSDVFRVLREFRRADPETPVVLMTYMHPIELLGEAAFAKKARQSGADGVLVVDLPPEEARPLRTELSAQELAPIFLLGASTTEERIRHICKMAAGYLYYVSLRGVTGSQGIDPRAVGSNLERVRRQTSLPVAVGFGIRDAESAAAIAAHADAVVVGTAVVERLARLDDSGADPLADPYAEVREFLRGISARMQR